MGISQRLEDRRYRIAKRRTKCKSTIYSFNPHETPQITYNFEVEDYHTYYVADGVLVHNKCLGGEYYRGGNDMTLKPNEYAVKDGLVVPGKDGISVNLNASEVARFGTPHKIVSLPDGLTIAQKGLNPAHYVIRPEYAMPLNQYQMLLYQVKLIPFI